MLGTCTALLLARRGISVSLFDAQTEPMRGAGRWNEGKIHQGYLYAADNTLATARRLLPGALSFDRIVSSLIERPVSERMTRGPDLLFTHVDSVVQPKDTYQYLKAVWALSREAGLDTAPPEQLGQRQFRAITEHPSISAVCITPEQSIDTNWLADQLVTRIKGESRVEGRFGETVVDLFEQNSKWTIVTDKGTADGFDVVVNALWEGRAAIDAKRGLSSPLRCYRYRASVFAPIVACDLPNFVVATGPFGDFKNYGNSVYLSWYPAGLLVNEVTQYAPDTPRLDLEEKLSIRNATIRALAEFIPGLARLSETTDGCDVQGGWVVAAGKGALSELSSGLHKRDTFGIRRLDSYVSVDVGKYSMAPFLAEQIVNEIVG
jgi:glycine/D-amino acid oxidase-like deaminating enzyme